MLHFSLRTSMSGCSFQDSSEVHCIAKPWQPHPNFIASDGLQSEQDVILWIIVLIYLEALLHSQDFDFKSVKQRAVNTDKRWLRRDSVLHWKGCYLLVRRPKCPITLMHGMIDLFRHQLAWEQRRLQAHAWRLASSNQ